MKKKVKIRLVLKSYDHQLLDKATKQIVLTARKTGAEVVGPVPLPNRMHVETVLRSPHVDKKSREQFSLTTHQRLLDILSPSEHTMASLMQISISAGVDVQVVNS